MDSHRIAEERSIALHRRVAEKMQADPAVLEHARARVAGWLADGSVHPFYARAWSELLDQPLAVIADRLVAPDEAMRAMRQSSPFAGALDPRERWAILRAVRP